MNQEEWTRHNEPQKAMGHNDPQWATNYYYFFICSCEKHEKNKETFLFKKIQRDIGSTMGMARGFFIQSTTK